MAMDRTASGYPRQVGFYPSREVKDRLTRAAAQENRSVSNLVVQIVEEYLETWGDEIGGGK